MGARHLEWDGLFNVRDLGGLPAATGETRWGAVVRSENPERLTAAGWDSLYSYGIRTIIDLRTPSEFGPDDAPRPDGLVTVNVQLDDYDGDVEFWKPWRETGLWATPAYYPAFVEAFPARIAAAVSAVARAEPGGVLVHCAAGKDRTGLVVLMLLALVGVPASDIAEDHAVSNERLRPLFDKLGITDQDSKIEALLAERATTPRQAILDLLSTMAAEPYLRGAGVGADDLAAIRTRLLG